MTRRLFVALLLATMALAAPPVVGTAHAEDGKMIGTVQKIQMADDGKSALATLKDVKSGEEVIITITDDLTLDKFKDHRIVEGDEIRALFDKQGGKNLSKSFKKTAGC